MTLEFTASTLRPDAIVLSEGAQPTHGVRQAALVKCMLSLAVLGSNCHLAHAADPETSGETGGLSEITVTAQKYKPQSRIPRSACRHSAGTS